MRCCPSTSARLARGYLLTGHGFFSCYEAFVHRRLDAEPAREVAQVCCDIPWRVSGASLNCLLSSHAWRQDHNGFSHRDRGS